MGSASVKEAFFCLATLVSRIMPFLILHIAPMTLSFYKQRVAMFGSQISKTHFRSGSRLSRLLRPIFEARSIRAVFGAQLAAAVVMVGTFDVSGSQIIQTSTEPIPAPVVVSVPNQSITTEERGFQIPTVANLGISSRFTSWHPGYDFRAPLGSEVRPIGAGVVVSIIHGSTGYGRYVVVDHGNGWRSLYAHLGKITVEEGDHVELTTKLGEVGVTGWTTGPHLHLEVYKDGVTVDPASVLPVQTV